MKFNIKFMLLILLILSSNMAYSFEKNDRCASSRYEHSSRKLEKSLIDQVIADQQEVLLRIGDFWIVAEGLQATSEGICFNMWKLADS